jgi:hypothetical protein
LAVSLAGFTHWPPQQLPTAPEGSGQAWLSPNTAQPPSALPLELEVEVLLELVVLEVEPVALLVFEVVEPVFELALELVFDPEVELVLEAVVVPVVAAVPLLEVVAPVVPVAWPVAEVVSAVVVGELEQAAKTQLMANTLARFMEGSAKEGAAM